MFFTCLCPSGLTGQINPKDLETRVDSIFMATFDRNSPGAAVAITLNGELLLAKGYGLANIEHKAPITPNSRFHLVSGSKQFTAYAILKLEQQGLLSLEDEIHKYLPELQDFGAPITIKHLLTHTSGIRQQTTLESMVGFWDGQILAHGRALELIFAHQELNFEPGSKFRYSDSGYTLLAEIIKRVTESPFDSWMQVNVFEPVGMNSTLIVNKYDKIVPDRAEPYNSDRNGYVRDIGGLWYFYGGIGVYASALDLTRWLRYLASPSPKDSALVAKMEQKAILNNGETIPWGLGLIINEGVGGRTKIWHGGDAPGYHAWLGRYPSEGLEIVVLTNLDSFQPDHAADAIAALFVPEHTPATKIPDPVKSEFDPSILDELIGQYETTPYPIWYVSEFWKIWKEGDRLFFSPGVGAQFALRPISDATFQVQDQPLTISFQRDDSGEYNKLSLTGSDGDQTAERISGGSFAFHINSAEELEGMYYSPELKTTYEILILDGKLCVRHHWPQINRRWRDFSVQAIGADYFISEMGFFKLVRFVRNSKGAISGLRVSSNSRRVENLWFEKQ